MSILLWLLATIVVTTAIACFAKHVGPSILLSLYSGSLVVAIFVASKIGQLPFDYPVGLSVSILVYSSTFIITDVLSEVYGAKTARKAVLGALLCYPIVILTSYAAVKWLPHPLYAGNTAFTEVMQVTGRISLASVIGFTSSQITDITLFHAIKKRTGRRYLWVRNNGSTIISQIVDTVVFYSIAFYGVFPIGQLIVYTIIAKIVIAAIDTPFVYFVKWYHGESHENKVSR